MTESKTLSLGVASSGLCHVLGVASPGLSHFSGGGQLRTLFFLLPDSGTLGNLGMARRMSHLVYVA